MTSETDVLDILGDEYARRILISGFQQPVTVEELVSECNVSPSTIYRRLRTLEELELIRSETDIRSGSDNQSIYRTEVDRLEIDLTPHGFHLELDEGNGDRTLDLLQDINFEHADIDFESGTIDLRMQFDPERLDQFVELWERIETEENPVNRSE